MWLREWEGEIGWIVERIRCRQEVAKRRVLRQTITTAWRDALWLRIHLDPPDPGEWRREHRRRSDHLFRRDDEIRIQSIRDKGSSNMSRVALDFKFALRRLSRTPRYTVLVIGVLALGIGATTTIATMIEAVLLRPLPYAESPRLVRALAFDAREGQLDWTSWAEIQTWRRAESFDRVASSTIFPATWRREEGSERVQRAFVSPGYFELLGVRPALGPSLALDDGGVVVSHRLWRQKWGSQADVIGRSMILDGKLYEVRAVAPDTLYDHDLGGTSADIWLSQSLGETATDPDFRIFTFYGRLKPGVEPSAAESELERLEAGLAIEQPQAYEGWQVRVEGLQESLVGHLRTPLVLLFVAVCLVLLIVAMNLSSLVLSRTVARRRELAIHLALGARAREIVRAIVTENLILAVAGGIAGIFVSYTALRLMPVLIDLPLPRQAELLSEPPRWFIGLLLALVTAMFFGTAPALMAMRRDLAPSLSDSGRENTGRQRAGGFVIAGQVALSVPLLMAALLLTQSLLHLRDSDLGLVPDQLLSQSISLPREWIGAPDPGNLVRVTQFFEETLSEVRALPGVTGAGAAVFPPFLSEGADRARFQIEGDPIPDPTEAPRALVHLITPGYFETLGTPMVAGRSFDASDDARSPPVMVISKNLARRWFGDRDPLGRSITTEWTFTPGSPATRAVVGIVEDVAQLGPAEPVESQIYIPHAQSPFPALALVVRSAGSPAGLVRNIRELVWEREPRAVLGESITLRQALSTRLRQPRFYAQLLGLFAGAAACLSALGLYGLLSYRVATQYRELGIRAALGATPRGLLAGVLKSGLRLTASGLVVGIVGAVALARLLESLLHGVGAYDPTTFIATTLLVIATTLAASWLPARRAARVGVVEALRLDE